MRSKKLTSCMMSTCRTEHTKSLLLTAVLFLPISPINIVAANKVVTFQYQPETATCRSLTSEWWDIDLLDFQVDCGNANHGCTLGHSIMIDAEFTANRRFETIADIDIKLCSAGICTKNIYEDDLNLCRELDLLDTEGYQQCNQPGNYTAEASFTLPSQQTYAWWTNILVSGVVFSLYVTLDNDLECHAQFVTHVFTGTETWMTVAVGSLVVLGVFAGYMKTKCKTVECCSGNNKNQIKDVLDDDNNTYPVRSSRSLFDRGDDDDASILRSQPPKRPVARAVSGGEISLPQTVNDPADDESVTTHAYLEMLDFSRPPRRGRSRHAAEEVERIPQLLIFERLRQTRRYRQSGQQQMIV